MMEQAAGAADSFGLRFGAGMQMGDGDEQLERKNGDCS